MKIAVPIKTLSELIQWEPDVEFIKQLVPFISCKKLWDDHGNSFELSNNIPQVIYCHDMAGGYLEADREYGMTSVFPAFRFTRWHLIDIFIYFSHHFITLPPLTWINLAHRQGVRVYGTVIFESVSDTFSALFIDQTVRDVDHFAFAYRLNWIRRISGFEGWLINFEVNLTHLASEVVDRILSFLRLLKHLGSEVVWYDAVTRHGRLDFQNALTQENECFLQTGIDGIFLNYNWNESRLQKSQERAGSAATSTRVFVGIDCFGRGCPGGGGFGTSLALKMILNVIQQRPDRPLSVALFAPGWPFEKCDLTGTDDDPCKAHHLISEWDERFWAPLAPLLSRIRGIGVGSNGLYRPTVMSLPAAQTSQALRQGCHFGVVLQTTCCTGQGSITSDLALGSSMSLQELIPTFRDCSPDLVTRDPAANQLVQTFQYACCGPVAGSGTCMLLRRSALHHKTHVPLLIELFSFAPGTHVSPDAHVEIAILPGGYSTSTSLLPTEVLLTNYKQMLGLDLFVDILHPVREGFSENTDRTVCQRHTIPCEQVTTSKKQKNQWIFLTFPFKMAKDSDGDCLLSLYRFGLSWSDTTHNAVPINEFLLGSIVLRDPNWLANAS